MNFTLPGRYHRPGRHNLKAIRPHQPRLNSGIRLWQANCQYLRNMLTPAGVKALSLANIKADRYSVVATKSVQISIACKALSGPANRSYPIMNFTLPGRYHRPGRHDLKAIRPPKARLNGGIRL